MRAERPPESTCVYGTMLEPAVAAEEIRKHGARMTAQRHVVLQVLAGNRTHPTAEALVAQVRERLGCVSPATIYNTLDTLEKLGFVRRIEGLEQRAHFDPDTSDHQHAICPECRRVWDIGPPAEPPAVPEGFTVVNIMIQGTCETCARKTS